MSTPPPRQFVIPLGDLLVLTHGLLGGWKAADPGSGRIDISVIPFISLD